MRRDRAEARRLYRAGGGELGDLPPTFAFLSPEWPWNVRVGANSPSLWPTMFSVTNTGTNLRPLCTANVRPTASGMIVERRDQVLMTFFCFWLATSLIFSRRWPSMNGPFLIDRAMGYPFFERCLTIMPSVRLF